MDVVRLAADTASPVDRRAEEKTILWRMRLESLENYEFDHRTSGSNCFFLMKDPDSKPMTLTK